MFFKQRYISIVFLFTLISGKKKSSRPNFYDEGVWDNSILYEDSVDTDERLLRQEPSSETLMQEVLDSLISNTAHLKRVDKIDFKVRQLDLKFHEDTDTIIKQLIDIVAFVNENYNFKHINDLMSASTNLTKLSKQVRIETNRVEPNQGHSKYRGMKKNRALDTRLTSVEGDVKSILADVDMVVSGIAEIQHRKYDISNAKQMSNHLGLFNELETQCRQQSCDYNCKDESKIKLRSQQYHADCFDLMISGFNITGVYKIKPVSFMNAFSVLCDLTSAGGGWTVFQNRFDGSQSYLKNWSDYSVGFGNLAGEFWLGLEKLHYMTKSKLNKLRIEILNMNGKAYYEEYSVFAIGSQYEGYRISILGKSFGNAGDSLSYHAGQKFSTIDVDNDGWIDGSCAAEHLSGWWYNKCIQSDLNGPYLGGGAQDNSITWASLDSEPTVTMTRMMIRPIKNSNKYHTVRN